MPAFSFTNVEASQGRSATIVEASKAHLLTGLTYKFGKEDAEFLATHVGFEDDRVNWEGVRLLGRGAFALVGLWAAKGGNGTNMKVHEDQFSIVHQLIEPGNCCQAVCTQASDGDSLRGFDHETIEWITML